MTPIKDRRGRVVQSRSAAIDITQTKRLERERREALEQRLEVERLREVNQFRTRLLNTAAHELNTPITPIMLQLHMLKKGHFGELTEGQERSVERLDRNMSRLASLVKDVLDVARLEAGKLKVSPEPTDLSGLLRETGASFATVAAEAGITMHVDAGDAIWVLADGGRISQVLFNLLDNAIKYTDAGGEVSVEAHRVGDDVVCRVRDTGVGMTADQMERLFTPFTKVHDDVESAREGTGLGLYICRGIVKQHGGRIWVDSGGPGAGTAVSFSLPAASPDQDGEREPAETDVEAPGLAAT